MTDNISTFGKFKDAVLVGLAGCAVLGAIAIVSLLMDTKKELAEIRVSIAIYQTQQDALRSEVARIRVEIDDHFREARGR